MKNHRLSGALLLLAGAVALTACWYAVRKAAPQAGQSPALALGNISIQNAAARVRGTGISHPGAFAARSKYFNPAPATAGTSAGSSNDTAVVRQRAAAQILERLSSLRRSNPNRPPIRTVPGGREDQVMNSEQQAALQSLRGTLGPGAEVAMDAAEGTLRYLHGDLTKVVENDPGFMEAQSQADAVRMASVTLKALERVLNLPRVEDEFVPQAAIKDDLGMTHVKFDQTRDGLLVYGGQIVVHFDSRGSPVQVNGVYAPATVKRAQGPQEDIGPEKAAAIARAHVGATGALFAPPETRKVVYWYPHQVPPAVTYQVDVIPGVTRSWHVFVSAADGAVVKVVSTVYSGAEVGSSKDMRGVTKTVNCWREGSSYYACDTTRPMYAAARSQPPTLSRIYGGILLQDVKQKNIEEALQNGQIGWSMTADKNSWDPTAVSLLNDLATVYDYYRTVHTQSSIDNSGASLLAYIHARFPAGQTLTSDNAFYSSTIKGFVFGDGDNAYKDLPSAMDVTAHEFTHGVTDHLAGLVYENQSGALSEHLSDFFACMVDRSNWTVGDGIIRDTSFIALRDLSDPHNGQVMNRLPKTMAEYQNLAVTEDQGGVHINCGIPNYATYLFTDGPQGMGRDKAERVVYRALKQGYLTSTSQFVDYRRALVQSAKDLYGDGAESAAVRRSFDSVGIVDGPTTPAPTPGTPTVGSEQAVFQKADYDPFFGTYLGNLLYVLDEANNFGLVTQDYLSETRTAIAGDGNSAIYVGTDNNIYWSDGTRREQWTTTANVRTIAMTKDQRFLAFTTTNYDNQVVLIDVDANQVSRVTLRVPTGAEGVEWPLEYADVLAFNFTGDLLVFDALAKGGTGANAFTCWGTYGLRVKDQQILTLFPPSPTLQVGNPSLANTLGTMLVADFLLVEGTTTNIGMLAIDLLRSEVGVLGAGLSEFAQPSFRGDDSKILYRLNSGDRWLLTEATLAADKLSIVAGSPQTLLTSTDPLAYPVGFRTGTYTPARGKCDILGAGSPPNRSINFGEVAVGSSALRTVTLTNSGNADLSLLQIQVEGADSASYTHDGINQVLPAGAALPVAIRLQPMRAGALAAALRVKTSVPGEADAVVSLSGSGLSSNLDTDHDGMTDYQEVLAGTDPANPASVFKLVSVGPASSPATGLSIVWQSVAGKTYTVSRSTNLSANPPFTVLRTGIPGTSGTTRYTDTNAAGRTPLFYRVSVP